MTFSIPFQPNLQFPVFKESQRYWSQIFRSEFILRICPFPRCHASTLGGETNDGILAALVLEEHEKKSMLSAARLY
jgi:hypothetical protein